jgi:hypothetical protein
MLRVAMHIQASLGISDHAGSSTRTYVAPTFRRVSPVWTSEKRLRAAQSQCSWLLVLLITRYICIYMRTLVAIQSMIAYHCGLRRCSYFRLIETISSA